ncbi:MAG: TPM domain-containing protein [Clostridia bacterium]|nr:TPM domain-containing protein [Clostridia bacterium]
MKKQLKRILPFCLVLLLCLCLCGCEEEKLTPTKEFYVNDFANVLEEDVKSEILSRGAELAEKTKAQVVAVTVDSTDGQEISDYALNLGRDWGIGDKEKNNGVLILLAVSDREVYIAVGYGLEGALPDSKTGRILDNYAVPYFKNDDFSQGMLSVYKAVQNEVYIEYGLEAEEGYVPVEFLAGDTEEDGNMLPIAISWIIMIAVIFIYIRVFGARGLFLFMGGPRGFGGGSRGGSGGFGGFSGGGGSFGGGGAGRGF